MLVMIITVITHNPITILLNISEIVLVWSLTNNQSLDQLFLYQIFGPVQQLIKFKTMDEVIEKANKTEYGLAAAIFTKDINKIMTYSSRVKAGTVW